MSKRVANAGLSCRVPHALTVFLSCTVRYGEVGCHEVISDWANNGDRIVLAQCGAR